MTFVIRFLWCSLVIGHSWKNRSYNFSQCRNCSWERKGYRGPTKLNGQPIMED